MDRKEMDKKRNGSQDDKLNSIEALADARDGGLQDIIAPTIERIVAQCYALLRQELEHKGKREPMLYSPIRIDRVMREFRAVAGDIQSTMARRVGARLVEMIQQEARRVFEDALTHVQDSLLDPVWDVGRGETAPLSESPVPWHPGEPGPRKEDPRHTPRADMEDSDEEKRARRVPPVVQIAAPPAPAGKALGEPVPSNGSGPAAQRGESEAGGVAPAPEAASPPEKPSPDSADEVSGDEVCEGTVRLNVDVNGDIRHLVHFVEALRQKPQLRLLQLVGNHQEGVSIWVGLREPLWLKKMLLEMEGVSRVSSPLGQGPSGSERLLKVWLRKEPFP